MALRRALSKRLFDGRYIVYSPSPRTVSPNAPKSSSHRECLTSLESDDIGFFRRFLQRRDIHNSPARLPEVITLPVGEKLRDYLKRSNLSGDRILQDDPRLKTPENAKTDSSYGISVSEARKILRLSQLDKLKANLRNIPKSSIPYDEFVRVCIQGCENEVQGAEFAKMLDESGNVIVLGKTVFLRPEQVAASMGPLISQSIAMPDDPRFNQLEQMEKEKAVIDQKAKALVKGELYCGLGFLTVQTLGFIRLTFWELSWDVMEPICFFVTSLHFALAYGFFLRTSTEPTFEGYFQRRFKVKQKKLMNNHKFDVNKYNELRKACFPTYNYNNSLHTSQRHISYNNY